MWKPSVKTFLKTAFLFCLVALWSGLLTVSEIGRNCTDINKLVQKCILCNVQEVQLRDIPACSRKNVSHTFLKKPEISNEVNFTVERKRDAAILLTLDTNVTFLETDMHFIAYKQNYTVQLNEVQL